MMTEPVIKGWASARRGVRCGDLGRVHHLFFVDNVVLLGKSLLELRMAFMELTVAMRPFGFEWKEGIDIVSSEEETPANIVLRVPTLGQTESEVTLPKILGDGEWRGEEHEAQLRDHMDLLGGRFNGKGECDVYLDSRKLKADGIYWQNEKCLRTWLRRRIASWPSQGL